MIELPDDLGHPVPLPGRAARVVSLVPSLTEALASVDRAAVVGATDWCTHPADLDCRRVRGTKNPDLAAVRALAPDVVVANKEENRELDVRRLRDSGVAVWVTDISTVPEAVASTRVAVQSAGRPRAEVVTRGTRPSSSTRRARRRPQRSSTDTTARAQRSGSNRRALAAR